MAVFPRSTPRDSTLSTCLLRPLRLRSSQLGAYLPTERGREATNMFASQLRDQRTKEVCLSYIQFLGAAGVVTGSKHLINTGDESGKRGIQVLVDCGLFQGQKEWRERNWQDLPIPAREIDAVILTHAHLDHSGWIPRLVKQGFHGPIYATPPTIDLCGILLPDSGHLQEEDAAFHNRFKTSKHVPALPLYTMEEAQQCLTLFKPVNFGEAEAPFRRAFVPVRSSGAHSRIVYGRNLADLQRWPRLALLFTGDIGRVRNSEISPGPRVTFWPDGKRTMRLPGDGEHLRQS